MFGYNHIEKIGKMFDPSIELGASLNDPMDFQIDEEMEWKYNTLDYPGSEFFFNDIFIEFAEPLSPQSQIRNHDCMWSGRCTTHPNECLNSRNNCNTKYVNEKTINQQQSRQSPSNSKNATTNDDTINIRPLQQQRKQNVPAGESLLRTRHIKPSVIKVPIMSTNDFLKNHDCVHNRPDTPVSMDESPPQFKHEIDLSACTMGSNKTNLLIESPTEIINILKEHLEDHTSEHTPAKVAKYMLNSADSLDELIKDMRTLSDFENDSDVDDDDDDDAAASESDATNDSFNVSNTMVQLPNSQASQLISSKSAKNQTAYNITQSLHSDHSYTRSKVRMDCTGLGVQTPSDSEEEIDVVSIGDKTLPTNPSARDCRALQNKITSRMVKTSASGATIARRRISNTSSEDSAYSSKCSPAIASPNGYTPIRSAGIKVSRKRVNQQSATVTTNAKRAKLTNKTKSNTVNTTTKIVSNARQSNAEASVVERQMSAGLDDSIEKRNQHNDMERQRRIGLKNLFENLKDKIPSLCEKERAPKVNILREATLLCNRLTQEEAEIDHQKQRRHRLQQRLKQLREKLAARGMY